jgi:hypothetical protein
MSNKKKHPKKVSEDKSKKVMWIDVRDYTKDPFVLKKIESSKKVFEKYGFPKELFND